MSEAKVLVFRVGSQEFAADISEVREVIAAPTVTTLPSAPAPVVGIFNLRGNIVTAIDGAAALGVVESGSPASRAVVADLGGHLIGILVDGASEVLTTREEDQRPTPRAGLGGGDPVARGVVLSGDRAIVLVDLARLAGPAATKAAAAPDLAIPGVGGPELGPKADPKPEVGA